MEFENEINILSQKLTNIIRNMQHDQHVDLSENKKLFDSITELQNVYRDRLIDINRQMEEKNVEKINIEQELESVKTEFESNFIIYKNIILQELGPEIDNGIYMRNYQIFHRNKLPAKIKQIPGFLETQSKLNILSDKYKLIYKSFIAINTIIYEIINKIKFIELIIQNIHNFSVYANQLIENYNQVHILTNDDTRVCQVNIIDIYELYNKQRYSSFNTEFVRQYTKCDETSGQAQCSIDTNESKIMDVFCEDGTYFYGIFRGIPLMTPKSNCNVLKNVEKTQLNHIFMDKPFITKLLLKDISIIKPTICRYYLFEYQTVKFIDEQHFFEEEFYTDEVPSVYHVELTPIMTEEEIQRTKIDNLLYNLLIKDVIKKYTHDESFHNFKSVAWYILIHLITSNNNYERKVALQNFKCLFAKSDREQISLYSDINTSINQYNIHPFNTAINLINIFIPEIKFLLMMNHLYKAKLRYHHFNINISYINGWESYCSQNKISKDTIPEKCLNFLLETVLSNLLQPSDYQKILVASNELTFNLLDKINESDRKYDSIYLFKTQMNHIISGLFNKKQGGMSLRKMKSKRKSKHIKKSRQIKKKSR